MSLENAGLWLAKADLLRDDAALSLILIVGRPRGFDNIPGRGVTVRVPGPTLRLRRVFPPRPCPSPAGAFQSGSVSGQVRTDDERRGDETSGVPGGHGCGRDGLGLTGRRR